MAEILFNAFSFLQAKLRRLNQGYANRTMEVSPGTTVADLIRDLGLEPADVEAAFINGRVAPLETILCHGDRLALVPPGTPGPYRVLLDMVKVGAAGHNAD